MENLKEQIQKAVTRDKVVLRAFKKLTMTHYTTRERGRACGCDYCEAMIAYVDSKIMLQRASKYFEATWGYEPKVKVIAELKRLADELRSKREVAKSLKQDNYV